MLNIAITGSFASGKSFVLNCCKDLGYKVFSCDDFVKEIYEDVDLQNKVVSEISELKFFDKKELSRIIYDNLEERTKLESIIHPLVREGIKAFENLYKKQKLIFTEVPLLFESGLENNFSKIICVYCSEEIRLVRSKARGVDSNLFEKIKSIQIDPKEKKAKSDFTIDSQNSKKEIEESLNNIIKQIT